MGYGQRIGRITMDWAINAARQHGHAVMALKNVHHLGRIGSYGEQAARAGMISVHFVNGVSGPGAVAPFGGTDGRMSTNPVCVAVPAVSAREHPLILDFATAAIALGKCRVAFNAGKPVPDGALVDAKGKPTNDPGVLYRDQPRGALLPFGGHKGYGLALMCEILAGALIGGVTAAPHHPKDGSIVNGWLAFVIDPARFGDLAAFRTEMAAVIAHVKASPPADPDQPVLVAGEKERATRAARLAGAQPWHQCHPGAGPALTYAALPAGCAEPFQRGGFCANARLAQRRATFAADCPDHPYHGGSFHRWHCLGPVAEALP
jgi:uncharacterized oxidoreductase